jgi:hypothetical protein
MRATYSLTPEDFKRLDKAITARFQRKHGRFTLPYFAQVFAWMFISLAGFSYYKQWQREPVDAAPYGTLLLFAAVAFCLLSIRPLLIQRLYWKYFLSSVGHFTREQSAEITDNRLWLHSAVSQSSFPRAAIIDHAEDDKNRYLFLTGVQAIIIPKMSDPAFERDLSSFLSKPLSEA